MLRFRMSVLVNLVIAVVLVADAFVVLLIYQQRNEPAFLASDMPLVLPTTTTNPSSEASGQSGQSPIDKARNVAVEEHLRGAMFVAQALYVQEGAFPATAALLTGTAPGLVVMDGVDKAGDGTIGMLVAGDAILFVGQAGPDEWLCVAADRTAGAVYYDKASSLAEVSTIGTCDGSTSGW